MPKIPCPIDLDPITHAERFQCQPWYVKLWRYRHYLSVPITSALTWAEDRSETEFSFHWSIAVGMAQSKMKWYLSMSEVKGRLKSRLK